MALFRVDGPDRPFVGDQAWDADLDDDATCEIRAVPVRYRAPRPAGPGRGKVKGAGRRPRRSMRRRGGRSPGKDRTTRVGRPPGPRVFGVSGSIGAESSGRDRRGPLRCQAPLAAFRTTFLRGAGTGRTKGPLVDDRPPRDVAGVLLESGGIGLRRRLPRPCACHGWPRRSRASIGLQACSLARAPRNPNNGGALKFSTSGGFKTMGPCKTAAPVPSRFGENHGFELVLRTRPARPVAAPAFRRFPYFRVSCGQPRLGLPCTDRTPRSTGAGRPITCQQARRVCARWRRKLVAQGPGRPSAAPIRSGPRENVGHDEALLRPHAHGTPEVRVQRGERVFRRILRTRVGGFGVISVRPLPALGKCPQHGPTCSASTPGSSRSDLPSLAAVAHPGAFFSGSSCAAQVFVLVPC